MEDPPQIRPAKKRSGSESGADDAGKKQLAGDTVREATGDEVKNLRSENRERKEVVAEINFATAFLKKSDRSWRGGRHVRRTASFMHASYPATFPILSVLKLSPRNHAHSLRIDRLDFDRFDRGVSGLRLYHAGHDEMLLLVNWSHGRPFGRK